MRFLDVNTKEHVIINDIPPFVYVFTNLNSGINLLVAIIIQVETNKRQTHVNYSINAITRTTKGGRFNWFRPQMLLVKIFRKRN